MTLLANTMDLIDITEFLDEEVEETQWKNATESDRKVAKHVADHIWRNYCTEKNEGTQRYTKELMMLFTSLFCDMGYMGIHTYDSLEDLNEWGTRVYKNEKLYDADIDEDEYDETVHDEFSYTIKEVRSDILYDYYKGNIDEYYRKYIWNMERLYPGVMEFIAWTMDPDGELYVDDEVKEAVKEEIGC